MRLTTEHYDTLAAIIGRREWSLAQTSIERATLVLDHCAQARIDAASVTPAQLSLAMSCMPLNAQDISNYADMACALAAVLPKAQPKSVNAELLATLSELLTAQLTQMPPYEAGKEAQDAWADRRASARNNASAAIANAMALARKYASECDCDGTGVIHTKQWPGGIEVDGEKPCEACEDIRKVIATATGAQA